MTSIKSLPADFPTAAQIAAFANQRLRSARAVQAKRRRVLADCQKARQAVPPPPPPPPTPQPVDLDALAREIADAKQAFEDLQKALREEVGAQLTALDDLAKAYTKEWASAMKELDEYVARARTISGPISELWKLQKARLEALQWAGIVDTAIQMGLMVATGIAAEEAEYAAANAAKGKSLGTVAKAETGLSEAEATARARSALAGATETAIGEPKTVGQAIENILEGYGDKLGDAAKSRLKFLLEEGNVKVAQSAEEWADIVGRYPNMAGKDPANIGGFFDPKTGQIFYPPGATPATIQHEVLHAASNPIFTSKIGGGFDEALTEHYATEFSNIFSNAPANSAYVQAGYGKIAQRLEQLTDHETVSAAYFGDSAQSRAAYEKIKAAVNKQAGSESAWDQLVEYSKLAEPRSGAPSLPRDQFVNLVLKTLQ